MTTKLTYIIEFVSDMDRAIKFYKDLIGLPLKFQSPGSSDFATGEITFALHPASEKNPAGVVCGHKIVVLATQSVCFNVPSTWHQVRMPGLLSSLESQHYSNRMRDPAY